MTEKSNQLRTYETICVLAFFSLAAGLYFQTPGLLYAALVILFLGIFVKPAAAWLAWGWLKFAHFLGTVNTKIILTLIFYLFLTPIAWLYRLFHGDFLKLKRRGTDSNWHRREHTYEKADLEKSW